MVIQFWYCPKCNNGTYNYRLCKVCGTPAVFQSFDARPVSQDDPGFCKWVQSEEDVWDTACKDAFYLEQGTPADNFMKYCPFCGRVLVVDAAEAGPPSVPAMLIDAG